MKSHNTPIHILFCSRLVEEKGVDILLDVIRWSLEDFALDHIVWHIASDGLYEKQVEAVSQGSSGRVVYHGKMNQQELAELMRSADYLYMPSRFLETFWLTALESIACGVPVIGIKKGGLMDFIDDSLAIDENKSVESTLDLLRKIMSWEISIAKMNVLYFSEQNWEDRIKNLFPKEAKIFLLHDYLQRIWGAEAYIDFLSLHLPLLGYKTFRYSYTGSTSPIKRRIMFIVSLFAFWRWIGVYKMLKREEPTHIWMHSVLRYFGYWWVRAVRRYANNHEKCRVFLSHHDVWFIAPFPQMVEREDQIPKSTNMSDFLLNLSGIRRCIAMVKWCYIHAMIQVMPKNMQHIVFSGFLKRHIENHFWEENVVVLPHTYDSAIFHP